MAAQATIRAGRNADVVTARFISGSDDAVSSTQMPVAISVDRACTHRQPRSLRLRTRAQAVHRVQQADDRGDRRYRVVAVEQRGKQGRTGLAHPIPVGQWPAVDRPARKALAGHADSADLPEALEMQFQRGLGVPAQLRPARYRP